MKNFLKELVKPFLIAVAISSALLSFKSNAQVNNFNTLDNPGTHVGTIGYSDTNVLSSFQSNVNSYNQIIIQNTNSGNSASSDYVVSNNLGTANTYYGDFGMNSSGFTGSGSLNQPNYVYLTSTSGDLAIGTTTSNGIHFVVNSGSTDAAAFSSSGAFSVNGTQTFADTSTWGSSGINDSASYSTSTTTAPINLAFTNSYSTTSNGVTGLNLSPTMTSTGASSGNVSIINLSGTLGTSSNSITTMRGVFLDPTIPSGYTGTVATLGVLEVLPTNNGTNPITNLNSVQLDTVTNGNGITSGTVTNSAINVNGNSAAAGSGGTLLNFGAKIQLGTGSSSGTNNSGVYIFGNGGASSTNYAIYDLSTAPLYLGGHSSASIANTPSIASAACGTGTNGTISGTDQNGKITISSATTTACAITFGSSVWANSGPTACVFAAASSAAAGQVANVYVSALSSSGFTLTGTALASTTWYYHCE